MKEKMEFGRNSGLKDNVISMYKNYFRREGFFEPRITKDIVITGKLKKHTVDIYFEFVQMNNLERTVVKIIEGREVTENDVWEFKNVLNDFHFLAKGIIYYDNSTTNEAKKEAELASIDLKKFDLEEEIKKGVANAIRTMLPDEDVIGDPFWVVMETEQRSGQTIGNYVMANDSILLFLSKKQASNYCDMLNKNAKVFGVTQNHLKILVNLQEQQMCPNFSIAVPEFEQLQKDNIICYQISCEMFKKFYLRGDNHE